MGTNSTLGIKSALPEREKQTVWLALQATGVTPKRDMRRSHSCIPSPFSWPRCKLACAVTWCKPTYLFFPILRREFQAAKFRDDPTLGLLGMSRD